jgi:hypothetical protein
MQCQFNDSVFLILRKSLALETIHDAHLASQNVVLSSKLPQMMVHVEAGVAHTLGPRHLTKHRVRSEVTLPSRRALADCQGNGDSRISRSQETQLAAFGASIGFSRKSAISP